MINDGSCLVNGKSSWTRCEKFAVDDLSDCEAACTAHEPCVGYFFDGDFCYLIPSNHSCPTGYYLSIKSIGEYSTDTAASINDLEASPYGRRGVCYGKNLGNIVRAN